MKDEFINIAAHELRTPIQPILGLSDIIYTKVKDEELHELLDIIMRNAKRLKRLTDNLLDVTKIESHSLMLNKEKFNMNILISEVLKDYVNKQKNQLIVKIVYDFKRKEDIIVEADRDRISQVIHNLLDNALKFTTSHNNQTIFVIVDKKKEGKGEKKLVIVSVKDTGEGIPEKTLPKLFSKFSNSNSTTGTGLGLYICRNIIEAHQGRIWAENNADENGATFSFTLPIAI
jgi:signal transduction histidine kinase